MRKGVPAAALVSLCAAALITARVSARPADPSAGSTRAEVRKWIEKGNAEWVEGFKRADAAMVVAGFASDAVNVGSPVRAEARRAGEESRPLPDLLEKTAGRQLEDLPQPVSRGGAG